MPFSAKTEYGLVSLLELASIHSQGGVLQVAEIAHRQGIPERYLEQMLTSLRRANILRSSRGPKGGYQLSRPPGDIRVADVLAVLEGENIRDTEKRSPTPEYSVLISLEERLEQARRLILEGATIQDLVDQRDQLAQAQAMYFI
jgi:Rrf2 family protein